MPAEAFRHDRRHVGFEINKKYISMFQRYARSIFKNPKRIAGSGRSAAKQFANLIVDLRILKYARLLYKSTEKTFGSGAVAHVLSAPLKEKPAFAHQICSAEYVILLRKKTLKARVEAHLDSYSKVKPLSKFGVDSTVRVITSTDAIPERFLGKKIFLYSATDSHKLAAEMTLGDALESKYPLISLIRANVEEPDE